MWVQVLSRAYHYFYLFFQYERAVKSFCEDLKQQPDEFFSMFDLFLTSFAEAKNENDRIKRMKLEEERRAKLEQVIFFY